MPNSPTFAYRTVALALILAGLPLSAQAILKSGDDVPAFSLANARGGTLALSGFKGKAVYLNFFATWCGPCNEEAPSVSSLYARYRKRGFVTVGVNEQEDSGKAVGFAKKYRWPFPIVIDADGGLLRTYGDFVGLPLHVFIDKRGKISTYRLGEMSPGEIDTAINKIL